MFHLKYMTPRGLYINEYGTQEHMIALSYALLKAGQAIWSKIEMLDDLTKPQGSRWRIPTSELLVPLDWM